MSKNQIGPKLIISWAYYSDRVIDTIRKCLFSQPTCRVYSKSVTESKSEAKSRRMHGSNIYFYLTFVRSVVLSLPGSIVIRWDVTGPVEGYYYSSVGRRWLVILNFQLHSWRESIITSTLWSSAVDLHGLVRGSRSSSSALDMK